MLERELRPTYYARQDVTAADLNQIYAYDDAAWRAHNRAFHGCGIVCGLEVRRGERAGQVWAVVSPGYALSPAGDEIEVREEVWVAIDCARNPDEACDDPGFDPAYIVLRPESRQTRDRPLAPAPCAGRQCEPTRVCPGYEIACSPDAPAVCPPPFDLSCCSAERLIHGALAAGDLGDTGLFGCLPPAGETAITLARIEFKPDPNRPNCPPPYIVLDDRAYVPALQFLFELAQRAGVQALKRPWQLEPAIGSLGEPPVRQLPLNRGFGQAIVVWGRALSRVVAVAASHPDIDITGYSVPAADRMSVGLRVPLDSPAEEFSLRLTSVTGQVFDGADRPTPVLIRLHDNPVESIPNLPLIFIARARRAGYTTAQSVAGAKAQVLAYHLFGSLNLVGLAQAIINTTREWLRQGAP